ncbi:MAG: hypothetical protein Q7T20_05400 [Saprospiraceae bacterium]|nr:hypothetical protein [Saprospiraceae bacterium]
MIAVKIRQRCPGGRIQQGKTRKSLGKNGGMNYFALDFQGIASVSAFENRTGRK